MHLGLSTYTFPQRVALQGATHEFSFREMLKITGDYKIGYFQFGDNYPLHLLAPNELDELLETASEKKIQLQAGTRGLHIDHIAGYLEIAEKLQSEFLRVVVDDDHYHPSPETVIKIIRQLLPLLEATGVILAIENHDRFGAGTLARIIEDTDPRLVGICLDTANSLGAGEGINEILPLLLPYTINVHIKDFRIARVNDKMGFTVSGAPAGEGMLDIPRLARECSRYKNCKTATLELWTDKAATPEKNIQQEMEWVKKSITYLNNHIQC